MNSVYPLPSVAGPEINASSDRRAMGYPEHYAGTTLETVERAAEALRALPRERLAGLVGDGGASLHERFAAGQLLALAGDPRLDPFAPVMLEARGGRFQAGLEAARVDAVMNRFADTGILRAWIEKETPRFETVLAPFRIAKFAVTNGEYLAFLKDSGFAEIPSSWSFGRFPLERSNHPVYTVSPAAADAYAAWLSDKTGRAFRLPRETEWEYAACGGEDREFPWGEAFEPGRANTIESGLLTTTPVGLFPAGNSPLGACDMAGNVEEYCADDYAPYPGAAAVEDDLARACGAYRVARGGSFTRYRDLARCRRRHGWYPRALYAMGFRLAEGA